MMRHKTLDRHETVDVVVLGAGGAGLAAAASASRRGVSTVVLEKSSCVGGTTRLAIGSISGACTRLQKAAGIADHLDDFRADMEAFTAELLPKDNDFLRCVLAAEAGVTIDWLESLGVAFAGPYPEPPHRVSRMHNTIPGPRMIVAKLENAAREAGTEFRMEATIHALLTGSDGEVVGVEYTHEGQRRRLFARRGVILATGDFSGSREMREAHLPRAASLATPINAGNLGEGHKMAEGLGAGLRNMNMLIGPQLRFPRAPKTGFTERLPPWTWLARLGAWYFMRAPKWMLKPLVTSLLIANMSPSERLFQEGAVLVDIEGKRLDTGNAAAAIAQAPQAKGYIVFDQRIAKLFSKYPYFISTAPGIAFAYLSDYLRGRSDIARRNSSVADLSASLAMHEQVLGESLASLEVGPLFVLGPVQAMLTTTEGSVDIDGQCRVLRQGGDPIEGLYAAGCVGQGGLLLRGHGLHLAWAFTSGRITGEMAARRRPAFAGQEHVQVFKGQ